MDEKEYDKNPPAIIITVVIISVIYFVLPAIISVYALISIANGLRVDGDFNVQELESIKPEIEEGKHITTKLENNGDLDVASKAKNLEFIPPRKINVVPQNQDVVVNIEEDLQYIENTELNRSELNEIIPASVDIDSPQTESARIEDHGKIEPADDDSNIQSCSEIKNTPTASTILYSPLQAMYKSASNIVEKMGFSGTSVNFIPSPYRAESSRSSTLSINQVLSPPSESSRWSINRDGTLKSKNAINSEIFEIRNKPVRVVGVSSGQVKEESVIPEMEVLEDLENESETGDTDRGSEIYPKDAYPDAKVTDLSIENVEELENLDEDEVRFEVDHSAQISTTNSVVFENIPIRSRKQYLKSYTEPPVRKSGAWVSVRNQSVASESPSESNSNITGLSTQISTSVPLQSDLYINASRSTFEFDQNQNLDSEFGSEPINLPLRNPLLGSKIYRNSLSMAVIAATSPTNRKTLISLNEDDENQIEVITVELHPSAKSKISTPMTTPIPSTENIPEPQPISDEVVNNITEEEELVVDVEKPISTEDVIPLQPNKNADSTDRSQHQAENIHTTHIEIKPAADAVDNIDKITEKSTTEDSAFIATPLTVKESTDLKTSVKPPIAASTEDISRAFPSIPKLSVSFSGIRYPSKWFSKNRSCMQKLKENFSKKLQKQHSNVLLHGVSGHIEICKSTTLTKSSSSRLAFLKILEGKMDPNLFSGKVYINGKLRDTNSNSHMGYFSAVQMELHWNALNVYETMIFAAEFKIPRNMMSSEDKRSRVKKTLKDFDLLILAKKKIRELNYEEKRRLLIASELINLPSIICLEEPFFGLDSEESLKLAQILKKLTKNSKHTLIFTAETISNEIFELIDKIMLLSLPGLCYFGPTSALDSYFAEIGIPVPENSKFAEFINKIDFEQLFPQQVRTEVIEVRPYETSFSNSDILKSSAMEPLEQSESAVKALPTKRGILKQKSDYVGEEKFTNEIEKSENFIASNFMENNIVTGQDQSRVQENLELEKETESISNPKTDFKSKTILSEPSQAYHVSDVDEEFEDIEIDEKQFFNQFESNSDLDEQENKDNQSGQGLKRPTSAEALKLPPIESKFQGLVANVSPTPKRRSKSARVTRSSHSNPARSNSDLMVVGKKVTTNLDNKSRKNRSMDEYLNSIRKQNESDQEPRFATSTQNPNEGSQLEAGTVVPNKTKRLRFASDTIAKDSLIEIILPVETKIGEYLVEKYLTSNIRNENLQEMELMIRDAAQLHYDENSNGFISVGRRQKRRNSLQQRRAARWNGRKCGVLFWKKVCWSFFFIHKLRLKFYTIAHQLPQLHLVRSLDTFKTVPYYSIKKETSDCEMDIDSLWILNMQSGFILDRGFFQKLFIG
ncbi:hypothetical protein HK098_005422 [Nowakowskiella sp. JEL0407]|nr:hypothetical protein HK098_005422 [Nowakowskiella sp. JEL0407]